LKSFSTEIDYSLLNECFELNTYDKLIKPDLLNAINNRYEQLKHEERIQKQQDDAQAKKLIEQERIKLLKFGQRIVLQQFCIEK
jgi:hypothetical protein